MGAAFLGRAILGAERNPAAGQELMGMDQIGKRRADQQVGIEAVAPGFNSEISCAAMARLPFIFQFPATRCRSFVIPASLSSLSPSVSHQTPITSPMRKSP
jgi:hypothetical protein